MKKQTETAHSWCCCGCGSSFWGWFFVVIGLYFLGSHLGYIPKDLPFWPLVLLIVGVYILVRRNKSTC